MKKHSFNKLLIRLFSYEGNVAVSIYLAIALGGSDDD